MGYYTKPFVGTPLIRTHALAQGLRSLYLLNENGGGFAYDSAGAYRGTVQSGATWSTAPDGPSLSFNGTTGYVSAPFQGTKTIWSLECLFRRNGNQGAQACLLTDNFVSGHINYAIWWNHDGSHATSLYAGWFDGSFHLTSATVVPDLTWTHAVATNDGTTVTLYVNGAPLVTGASNTTATSDSNGFTIGRKWDAGTFFNGRIAKAAVYDRVLTANAVQELYADPYQYCRPTLTEHKAGGIQNPIRSRRWHRQRRLIGDVPYQPVL